MKICRSLVYGFILVGFVLAHAADSDTSSQYRHQAAEGVYELTPLLAYTILTVDYNNSTSLKEAESKTTAVQVSAEYGVNTYFSVGARLSYGQGKTTYTPSGLVKNKNFDGLYDPEIYFLAQYPLGTGSLRFGGDLSFSIEDDETDSSGDSNNASGGTVFTPYVGYELTVGPGIYGASIAYDLYKGDRKSVDKSSGTTTKTTYSGGEATQFTLYAEFPFDMAKFGLAVDHYAYRSSKSKTNGVTTSSSNPNTSTVISVYLPYELAPNMTLVPLIFYGSQTTRNYTSVDSISAWGGLIGLRMAF